FEPFFTTKAAGMGTGLGLAVCHRIVTQLGGELELVPTPGATTFRVTLPPGEAEAVAAAEPARSSQRARILVVDDEPLLLRAIGDLIGEVHEVVTVSS